MVVANWGLGGRSMVMIVHIAADIAVAIACTASAAGAAGAAVAC